MATQKFKSLTRLEAHIRAKSYSCKNANAVVAGKNPAEIAENMFAEFERILNFISQDSSQYDKTHKLNERIIYHIFGDWKNKEPQELGSLKAAFKTFAEQCFDDKGNLKSGVEENLPRILTTLVEEVTKNTPVSNKHIAIGKLLSIAGNSDKLKPAAPNGIDFSRSYLDDKTFLDSVKSALSNRKNDFDVEPFDELPKNYKEFKGRKYITYSTAGREYFVAKNGDFMIPKNGVLVKTGMNIVQFLPLPDKDGLKPTGELLELWNDIISRIKSLQNRSHIDGVAVNSEQPLIDIQRDKLTGLDMAGGNKSELHKFKAAALKAGFKSIVNLLYKNGTEVPNNWEDALKNYNDNFPKIDWDNSATQKRLEPTLKRVWDFVEKEFKGKTPVTKEAPKFFIMQGGTGSGKSNLIKKAQLECGGKIKYTGESSDKTKSYDVVDGNVVIATLDDSRIASELYPLYVATNNHSDDYSIFTEFGNAARELTLSRARKDKFNVILDGSGIAYANRNDLIVADFKKAGFRTELFSASAPLYAMDAGENHFANVLENAVKRLHTKLRIVPYNIIAAKHIGFPEALMEAFRDKNIDFMMLQDHSQQDLSYAPTLSFTASRSITENEIKEFEKITAIDDLPVRQEKFMNLLHEKNLIPDIVTSAYPTWQEKIKPNGGGVKHREKHIPEVDFKIVRHDIANGKSTYRMQVILDMDKYSQAMLQGLLDERAKGPDGFIKNTLKHDISGDFRSNDGKLTVRSMIVTPAGIGTLGKETVKGGVVAEGHGK